MTSDFQERAWQGFCSGTPQSRVIAPLFLFILDGPDEAAGDVPFCRRLDQGVAILERLTWLLFEFGDAPFKTGQHLLGFLVNMSELTIGQIGHICHKHFSMVPKRQKRWSGSLAMA